MKVQSGIYQIKNKTNGKIYIGSSIDIKKRWVNHKSELGNKVHHNSHLQRSWNKYGEGNFEFIVLEKVDDVTQLLIREQYYMDLTQCYDSKFGYNNSKIAGNCLGVKHSEETRRKISVAATGRKHTEETLQKFRGGMRSGKNSPRYGVKMTQEQKEHLSKSKKGKKQSEEHRIKNRNCRLGELNKRSILTEKDVVEIKLLLKHTDLYVTEIAKIYKIKSQSISSIKFNKNWKQVEIPESMEISKELLLIAENMKVNRKYKKKEPQ